MGLVLMGGIESLSDVKDIDLASLSAGDILTRSPLDTWVNLPAGPVGSVLTAHGPAVLPTWEPCSADISGAVVLAPDSPLRNRIQPTADGGQGLSVIGHSATHWAPLFEALAFGSEDRALGVYDSRGFSGSSVQVQGTFIEHGALQVLSAYGQTALNGKGRYVDFFQQDADGNRLSGLSVMCLGSIVPNSKGANLYFWGQTDSSFEGAGAIVADFLDNDDANYRGRLMFVAEDFSANREFLRGEADGAEPRISFLGAEAVIRQSLPAAATDEATTMALTNSLRDLAIAFGLAA